MSNFKDQEQASYSADPATVDLSVIIETYKALLSGDNLPERVAVQTVVLQTLLEAATATIPHLSAPCSVDVKKLEWVHPDEDNSGFWKAKSAFGTYYVFNDCGWHTKLYDYPQGQFFEWSSTDLSKDTNQTAFAAAQADNDRRILSQIVTKPVDLAALREQWASPEGTAALGESGDIQ